MMVNHFKWIADRVPKNTGMSKQIYRPELAAAHKSLFMDNCLDFHLFQCSLVRFLLSGEPDYFGRNEISSGGDLSHYSSASLY